MSVIIHLYALAPESCVLPRDTCAAMVQAAAQMKAAIVPDWRSNRVESDPVRVRIVSLPPLPTVPPQTPDDPPYAIDLMISRQAPGEPTIWFNSSDLDALAATLPAIPFGGVPLCVSYCMVDAPDLYVFPEARSIGFINPYDGSCEYHRSAYIWRLGFQKREPPIYSAYPVSKVINRFFGGIIPVYIPG